MFNLQIMFFYFFIFKFTFKFSAIKIFHVQNENEKVEKMTTFYAQKKCF